MTAEEEARLVRRAARGDAAAFEALVREHQRNVYNLALKLTGSHEDALDVSQDAFLKAYTALASFRGESRFSVWLYRLTYNAGIDLLKKNRRSGGAPLPTDEDGAPADFPDDSPTPEELSEREETRAAVRAALDSLSEEKREILILREFRGMSYSDIAAALNIEEGTVKSRIARARLSLAEILRNDGTLPAGAPSKGRKGGKKDA